MNRASTVLYRGLAVAAVLSMLAACGSDEEADGRRFRPARR